MRLAREVRRAARAPAPSHPPRAALVGVRPRRAARSRRRPTRTSRSTAFPATASRPCSQRMFPGRVNTVGRSFGVLRFTSRPGSTSTSRSRAATRRQAGASRLRRHAAIRSSDFAGGLAPPGLHGQRVGVRPADGGGSWTPHGGLDDLRAATLRAVDAAHLSRGPAPRRGARFQFAARLDFNARRRHRRRSVTSMVAGGRPRGAFEGARHRRDQKAPGRDRGLRAA